MAIDKMSVKACAPALGLGWDTVNTMAFGACRHLAYGDLARLAHVRVLGVGPVRLLDMVPGRSAGVFGDWLAARPDSFRVTVKVTTMDVYTGNAKAAGEHLHQASTVMDPFYAEVPDMPKSAGPPLTRSALPPLTSA